MPYLFQAARYAHTNGVPMMRSMVVEFPDDPGCSHLERQYMLGDDLLVAPLFSGDERVAYYVPDGTWTHFLIGERVQGPRWATERHGFTSVPLLARPGSVIPVGAVEDRPDYDYVEGVTLRVYELPDGARVTTTVPTVRGEVGATFLTSRNGNVVRVEADPAPTRWQVLLVGVRSATVTGGTAAPGEYGLLVRADAATVAMTLEGSM